MTRYELSALRDREISEAKHEAWGRYWRRMAELTGDPRHAETAALWSAPANSTPPQLTAVPGKYDGG